MTSRKCIDAVFREAVFGNHAPIELVGGHLLGTRRDDDAADSGDVRDVGSRPKTPDGVANEEKSQQYEQDFLHGDFHPRFMAKRWSDTSRIPNGLPRRR